MTVGSNTLYFAYDASGTPMSVTYNGTNYYYATNIQGDVTAILNTSGTAVVQYTYDAWGKILATTGSMASTLGAHNPLCYRGYVYDTETTLYYLQSRYYDPEMGRFINGDAYATTGQGVLGNNMFAYCRNNPVCYDDPTGEWSVLATKCVINIITSIVCDLINHESAGDIVVNAILAAAGTIIEPLGDFMTIVDIACSTVEVIQNTGDVFYGLFVGGLGVWASFATGETIAKLLKIENLDEAAELFVDVMVGFPANVTYAAGQSAEPGEFGAGHNNPQNATAAAHSRPTGSYPASRFHAVAAY